MDKKQNLEGERYDALYFANGLGISFLLFFIIFIIATVIDVM